MSKSRTPKRSSQPPPPSAGRQPVRLAVVVLIVSALAAVGLWWNQQRNTQDASADLPPAGTPMTNPPPAAVGATNQAPPAATPNPVFAKLKGRWLRPDGDYVLEIRSVEPDGKLDATYSNPKSIHVAKAEASQQGAMTKVFVELRDVNYPGSTYTLGFDPATDQLSGIYFQALQRQSFEVVFVRMR